MKSKIINTSKVVLKAIGRFVGTVAVLYILFCLIIFVIVVGFYRLHPEQFQVFRSGLLFLLFFVVAIPLRLNWRLVAEFFKKIPRLIPSVTKKQLIGLASLVAKLVLWGCTLFFMTYWVYELLYPLEDYPDGYINLGKDVEVLFFIITIFVFLRLIVLHFYPQFSYDSLVGKIKDFILKRKISNFSAFTSLILLIFSMFIFVNFFNVKQGSSLNWRFEEYREYESQAYYRIDKFLPDQNKISGTFNLYTNSPVNQSVLAANTNVIFDSKRLPINSEHQYVDSEVDVEISGSDYYFPFNTYEVTYLTFYPEKGYFEDKYNFLIFSNLSSVVLEKNYDDSYNGGPYAFRIKYSLYFKLLVITIGIAFTGFFVAVVMAKTRNQIVELSIGIFAALIAIRGFLVPNNLSSPILLDQVFLLYIILLIVVFLSKINQLKWEES